MNSEIIDAVASAIEDGDVDKAVLLATIIDGLTSGEEPNGKSSKSIRKGPNAYTFNDEDCPECGASMEGDTYTGKCNSCGTLWGKPSKSLVRKGPKEGYEAATIEDAINYVCEVGMGTTRNAQSGDWWVEASASMPTGRGGMSGKVSQECYWRIGKGSWWIDGESKNNTGMRTALRNAAKKAPKYPSKSIFHQWQKTWLVKQSRSHKKSCVMALLEGDARQRVLDLATAINDDDLAEKGREDQPHITVRYGLHDDDAEPVRELVETFGVVQARLGKLDYFPSDEHDVLIIRVESEDLHALYELLGQLPNTENHPEYQPHVTIAYVKPGMGEVYMDSPGATDLVGLEMEFTELVFSPSEGVPTSIDVASYEAQEAGRMKRIDKLVVKEVKPVIVPEPVKTEAQVYTEAKDKWQKMLEVN